MKNILLSGAGGMVGRSLINEFLSNDYQVNIYASDLYTDFYQSDDNRLHIVPINEIERTMSKIHFDSMLQLAFPRNVKPEQWANGIKFAIDILFLAKKYEIERVINISSQSIYGLQRIEKANEESSISLNSPYTTGKYCSEVVLSNLFEQGKFSNIRLSTIISPTTTERVPNKLFQQVCNGKDLIIKGGNQLFSFLDNRDAASGLANILTSLNPLKKQYNLGTSESHTLLEIAEKIINITSNDKRYSKILIEDEDIVLNNTIDVLQFMNDFNWTAKYTLDESLNYIYETTYKG